VVAESLEPAGCTAKTLEAFGKAQQKLIYLGADLLTVSVPLWSYADDIWLAVVMFGFNAMAHTFGQGHGHLGRIDVEKLVEHEVLRQQGFRRYPFAGRALPLAFEHLKEVGHGAHFGLAHNLRLELRRQIDLALAEVDVLVTPTIPTGPAEIDRESSGALIPKSIVNTCPLNLTGHPALTVPSGPGDDGLPTGLQIVGRAFHEHTVYRVGSAFEEKL
jgi:amidase